MKTPNDYKRNYKFRTNTKIEKRIMNITVLLVILFIMIWYAYQIWGT